MFFKIKICMKQIISLSNFHKPKPKTTSFWHGRKKPAGAKWRKQGRLEARRMLVGETASFNLCKAAFGAHTNKELNLTPR